MRYKVDTLSGAPLGLAVAVTEGIEGAKIIKGIGVYAPPIVEYSPSTNWAHGGPIIEREHFQLTPSNDQWQCSVIIPRSGLFWATTGWGQTPLIAAMRCYVKSRHGGYIDLDVQEES